MELNFWKVKSKHYLNEGEKRLITKFSDSVPRKGDVVGFEEVEGLYKVIKTLFWFGYGDGEVSADIMVVEIE